MQKLKTFFTFLWNTLLDIILPQCCFVCGRAGGYVCKKHKKILSKHTSTCYLCHTPTLHFETCLDHKDTPCAGVLVGFYYDTLIKDMIHAVKYAGAYEVLSFFVNSLVYDILSQPRLLTALQNQQLIISYVPMHWWKQHHIRGYNQAKILAEILGRKLGSQVYTLCKKIDHTKSQTSFGRNERVKNTASVFMYTDDKLLEKPIQENITTVLLVDDILTTGATLDACAKEIKHNLPGIEIWGLCIARHG